MQNFNNAPPPRAHYGGPPVPAPKKGMSTGVKVFISVDVLFVLGTDLFCVVGGC